MSGDLESGKPQFAINFKSVVDWLKEPCPYGPQVSVCTFKDLLFKGDHVLSLRDCGCRAKEWVQDKPYLVAESDTLAREQFGNVARWIQKFTTLRAVVDTGGISIHCWFDMPKPPPNMAPPAPGYTADLWRIWNYGGQEEYDRRCCAWKLENKAQIARDEWQAEQFHHRQDEFYAILRGLGCDPGMFRLASTARLPGVKRVDAEGFATGRWQRLIFLNPKFPIML